MDREHGEHPIEAAKRRSDERSANAWQEKTATAVTTADYPKEIPSATAEDIQDRVTAASESFPFSSDGEGIRKAMEMNAQRARDAWKTTPAAASMKGKN